jgi:hypothetical protein
MILAESLAYIDEHGLKIQGTGYLMSLAKSWGGGQGFQEKLPGESPFFRFYFIFIKKCFEICLRGVLYLPVALPFSHQPSTVVIFSKIGAKHAFSKIYKYKYKNKNILFDLWKINDF